MGLMSNEISFKHFLQGTKYSFIRKIDNTTFIVACPIGHEKKVTYYEREKHLRSQCKKCWAMQEIEKIRVRILEKIKSLDYSFVGPYLGSRYPFKVICDKGHPWNVSWVVLKRGGTCPKCALLQKSSKPENLIASWLKSEGVVVTTQFRCKDYYYDIMLPEYNLLIEYHGLYWHSTKITDIRELTLYRQLFKYHVAENHGYRLFQIWSDLWDNPIKQEILKSMLLKCIASKKIEYVSSENCFLQKIENGQAQDFYRLYDIEGELPLTNQCIDHYGLFHKDILIMAFSFALKRRQPLELLRVTNKNYTHVKDGLSAFTKHLKVPMLLATNNMYPCDTFSIENSGFRMLGVADAQKIYTDGHYRYSLEMVKDDIGNYRILYDAGHQIWGYLTQASNVSFQKISENETRDRLKRRLKANALNEQREKSKEQFVSLLKTHGYELVENEVFLTKKTKLTISCTANHTFKNSYFNLVRLKEEIWCPICRSEKRETQKEITTEMIEDLKTIGFAPISQYYIDIMSVVDVVCLVPECGGQTSFRYRYRKSYVCPKCSERRRLRVSDETSKAHLEKKAKGINATVIAQTDKVVDLLCGVCNKVFTYSLANFSSVNCPICSYVKKLAVKLESVGLEYVRGDIKNSRSIITVRDKISNRLITKRICKIKLSN